MPSTLLFCFISLLLGTSFAVVNDRPIIGVYTQPSSSEIAQFGEQFIAASYVKFMEGAGARVVPVR